MIDYQFNAVPDVILGILWVGMYLLRKCSVAPFQNPRMVYAVVPGTVRRQICILISVVVISIWFRIVA